MSKIGQLRRQRDNLAKRRPADAQTEPVDGEATMPDLWDIAGVIYPGSPKTNRNHPIDVMMVDVWGERVKVARKNKQAFRNPGTRPSVVWLWRPESVPQLWEKPQHHALTHALHLFQVVSRTHEGHHVKPEERLIRGGIHPSRLLQECGASTRDANRLVALLCEHDLLRSEHAGASELWFVTTRIRGVGAGYKLYNKDEIPEWILPELLDAPHPPREEEEEEVPPPTKEDSTAQAPLLLRVYGLLAQLAEESAETPREGYEMFILPGDFNAILARRLGVEQREVKKCLDCLRLKLGVYKTAPNGKGKPFKRLVLLGQEKKVASVATETAESKQAGKAEKLATTAEASSEAPPSASAQDEATTEEVPLLIRVYSRLVQYCAEVQSVELLEDGWAKFTIRGKLDEMLAQQLGTSTHATKQALGRLHKKVGVYRTAPAGRGNSPFRFVKLDAGRAVASAAGIPVEGTGQTAEVVPPSKPADEAEPPAENPGATAKEINQIFEELGTRLDEYSAKIDDLEQKLADEREAHAATRRELEEAKMAKTPVVIPESLARHLKKD